MTESHSKTPSSFLSNAAARAHGFTDEFWLDVYNRYHEEVANDPDVSFDRFERARTIRVPFQYGSVDVLIRFQPRPYEYWVMRFTAFPVAKGDEFREIPRWYRNDGSHEVLGEASSLQRHFVSRNVRPWLMPSMEQLGDIHDLAEGTDAAQPPLAWFQLAMSDLCVDCNSLDQGRPSGGRLIVLDSEPM